MIRQEIQKDQPRKKGLWRFAEVFFGNLRDLSKLNLLFCLCVAPSVVIFLLGFFGFYTGIMYALSLLAAFPVGGAIAAYVFCTTRMLRDEPGYIWNDFKRKFLENMKQAAMPGILCVTFIYAQVLLWGTLLFTSASIDAVWLALGISALVVFGMVTPYVFLLIAYVDIKTTQVVKNSMVIAFIHAPRSFMGVLTGGLIWIALILFLPVSLLAAPLILLIGVSFSLLLCLMWVWPPVNKLFKIEETLRERKQIG